MEKCFDEKKIAKLTGTAVQDDETFKAEGGFVPERDQFYFEMKQGNHVFMVGFKELLICLRLLEKMLDPSPNSTHVNVFEMAGIDPKKVEENTKLINDLINSMN